MVEDEGLHITCIISDSFLLWSQDVANKWRISRVSFWPQSLTAFACSISLPNIMAAYPNLDLFKDEVYRSEACRVVNCIPGLPDFAACRLPFLSLGGDMNVKWLSHHLRVQMERVNEPLCIICNTFPLLKRSLTKGQGKVIKWAPQLRVLSHDAVGGFFTHCGWNSTLESVSLGVPVIGWPQMMDQNTNCWFQVEKLKVGLRLELDTTWKVGHEGVGKAVRALMQEEEGDHMRARARNFSSLAQHAFKTSLGLNLDSFVQAILTGHKKYPKNKAKHQALAYAERVKLVCIERIKLVCVASSLLSYAESPII
ncbi:hypothetical protein L7F22_054862 [Adiantum nelumboides]|nr:hypothetical protein [Adiantum nelumboides]